MCRASFFVDIFIAGVAFYLTLLAYQTRGFALSICAEGTYLHTTLYIRVRRGKGRRGIWRETYVHHVQQNKTLSLTRFCEFDFFFLNISLFYLRIILFSVSMMVVVNTRPSWLELLALKTNLYLYWYLANLVLYIPIFW